MQECLGLTTNALKVQLVCFLGSQTGDQGCSERHADFDRGVVMGCAFGVQEWLLKLRAASETYLDESRIKFRVIAAEPLQQRLKEATSENISITERILNSKLKS